MAKCRNFNARLFGFKFQLYHLLTMPPLCPFFTFLWKEDHNRTYHVILLSHWMCNKYQALRLIFSTHCNAHSQGKIIQLQKSRLTAGSPPLSVSPSLALALADCPGPNHYMYVNNHALPLHRQMHLGPTAECVHTTSTGNQFFSSLVPSQLT